MAAQRMILGFFIATFCFWSLIDAAAVNNLFFEHRSEDAGVLADRLEIGGPNENAAAIVRAARSIEPEIEQTRTCISHTPCGWAVYIPFTRRVDYFMKNTCICPELHKCIRTDDDLSVSAYVYRCKNNPSPTDIAAEDA